jgi:hypothetical protein
MRQRQFGWEPCCNFPSWPPWSGRGRQIRGKQREHARQDYCRDVEIRNCNIVCGVTIRDTKVSWGNRPDYFTNALEAERAANLAITRLSGDAAHSERDQAILIH